MTHASQFGTRQSWKPDLTCNRKADKTTMLFAFTPFIDSICASTPSPAGGTQSGPRGTLFRVDCCNLEARLDPLRTIPRPTDRRGARAPRKGTCCETLEHLLSPSPPFPTKIYPAPDNRLPSLKRSSHSILRLRSRSPPQGVPEKDLEHQAQVSSPEAKTKAGHRAGTPRHPGTLGDSTVH